MALEYRLGHWFPFRGHDSYELYEDVVGAEPPDGWTSIMTSASSMADFQWRAKELRLQYVGTYDVGSGPTPISGNHFIPVPGRGTFTTFEELWAAFVVGGSKLISVALEVPVSDSTISTKLFFSLGGIWIVGTEADTPFIYADETLCRNADWAAFTVPTSFQLGSSGGDTIDPDFSDPGGLLYGGVIGRFEFNDIGMSFNIFRERSNRTVFFDTLDVTLSVSSHLILPTPA